MSRHERECPDCHDLSLDWVEVDIGVGVQRGPKSCMLCGWGEADTLEMFELDDGCPFEALGLGVGSKE